MCVLGASLDLNLNTFKIQLNDNIITVEFYKETEII